MSNKVKESIVAFGDIGSAYAVAIEGSNGDHFRIKNGTNADLVMKFTTPMQFNGTVDTDEVTLLASDISEKIIVVTHSGDVSIKRKAGAPTSGSLLVQSIMSR